MSWIWEKKIAVVIYVKIAASVVVVSNILIKQ
jgi:hypothetical protein